MRQIVLVSIQCVVVEKVRQSTERHGFVRYTHYTETVWRSIYRYDHEGD